MKSLTALLDEMLVDEGFKRFLENTRINDPSPLLTVEPEPTLQTQNVDTRLTAVIEALHALKDELASTRIAFQELGEDKALLQGLERQALNRLLKELGLSG